MPVSVLNQIEELANRLSQGERLLLIERLASAARQSSENEPRPQPEVAAMANGQTATQIELNHSSEAARQQAQLTAAWNDFMRQMGISGEPISAEELQSRIAANGIRPEDNEFSRGIIAMREE